MQVGDSTRGFRKMWNSTADAMPQVNYEVTEAHHHCSHFSRARVVLSACPFTF